MEPDVIVPSARQVGLARARLPPAGRGMLMPNERDGSPYLPRLGQSPPIAVDSTSSLSVGWAPTSSRIGTGPLTM